MASTGSVDGWPLGPMESGEAGLRVLLRLPTQASSSYKYLARGMMCEYVSLVDKLSHTRKSMRRKQ